MEYEISDCSNNRNIQQTTAFAQQMITAWRPVFTPWVVIIVLFVLCVIFCSIGGVLYHFLGNLPYYDVRYDDKCKLGEICTVDIDIAKEITGNIYLFYRLTNFYQNHARYIKSRSYAQLNGKYIDSCDQMSDVKGFCIRNDKMLVPSGAVPLSIFRDEFNLSKLSLSLYGLIPSSIHEKLYAKLDQSYNGTDTDRWLKDIFPKETLDERFEVWLRTSALSDFMKIYGKCTNCRIPAGKITVTINNIYDTESFKGEKHIILAKVTKIGGKNRHIGFLFIGTGVIFFVFALVVIISRVVVPRKFGDATHLQQNN